MKKSVAWIACLCMLAALLPAGALAADVAGGDYDFESDYTWNTGYNFPTRPANLPICSRQASELPRAPRRRLR